jgi:hypothetical protein
MQVNGIYKLILMNAVLELIDHYFNKASLIKQYREWQWPNRFIKIKLNRD